MIIKNPYLCGKYNIMKFSNVLKIISLSILLSLSGWLFAQIQTITWQNVERQYIMRTPTEHQGPLAVMYFLHGLGDNITRVDASYNCDTENDENGHSHKLVIH